MSEPQEGWSHGKTLLSARHVAVTRLLSPLLLFAACTSGSDGPHQTGPAEPASATTPAQTAPASTAPAPTVSASQTTSQEQPVDDARVCADVAKCIAPYVKPTLTGPLLRRLVEEGVKACFAVGDAKHADNGKLLAQQGRCLPLPLGRDVRNRKVVQLAYHCSDLCPNNGIIAVLYADVAKDDCCAVGGSPANGAWARYYGCNPPEVPLRHFRSPRQPDGPPEPVTRPPCKPGKIVFDDGQEIDDPSFHPK
ncbi:MAG: hypothetical protein U0441_11415 [Polyangiaceae bacterium]